jgi:hypothetical protein
MLRALLLLATLLAGCAAYDGGGLVPGQSVAEEVEREMGPPAERLAVANGDELWFYPRQPFGRQMYAVSIRRDGVMRGIEQTLTEANVARIATGKTTVDEVHRLLGPPWRVSRLERQQRDVWEYRMYNAVDYPFLLYVQFSGDGLAREVLMLRDYGRDRFWFEPIW